jgi:hypothetical protein
MKLAYSLLITILAVLVCGAVAAKVNEGLAEMGIEYTVSVFDALVVFITFNLIRLSMEFGG